MRAGIIWTMAGAALLATSAANAASPSRVVANSAARKLSVSGNVRAGTAIKRGNHLASGALALVVVAGAAAAAGIVAAASGSNSASS